MAEQAATAAPSGVWETLRERLAFGSYVPVPVSEALVEERVFATRSGDAYHVLKHRERRSYLSLSPDAHTLWRMMNGVKPIRQIAVEYALIHNQLVTGLLRSLVDELRDKGFLENQPARIFSGLVERRRRRTLKHWLMAVSRSVISCNLVELRRGDSALGALYQSVGWLFFSPPVVLAMWLILVAGLYAWVAEVAHGGRSLVRIADSYALGFLALLALSTLAITFHELGHALAVKHKRREVIATGLLLYYGMPCAYVDTSDIWMVDRRSRILVSWAGPFVTLTLAGLMGLVALVDPGTLTGDLAFKASSVWFLDGLYNFIPLLELDGYFMLVDALEMPLLRARAFHFLRVEVWRKLRAGAPWTRDERILAAFGLLAMWFSAATLIFSVWIWNVRGARIVEELWSLPAWYGRPLVAVFVLVFAAPLVLSVVTLLAEGLRGLCRQVAWHLNERRLAQRAEPMLDALPYLRHLSPAERTALASHVQVRRLSAGATVLREGEPPDGFYLIRSGEVEVERQGPGGQGRLVAVLVGGDHFGEIAFITRAPRNATVRARTDLELFYLDGSHFNRWLADDMQGRAEVRRRMIDEAVIVRVRLLSSLTPAERDQLLQHTGVEHFAAGAVVFRQGDLGGRVYLVARGRFEVLARSESDPADEVGRKVAELSVGDHYGEIALLNDEPRTATIRALEPSVCYVLSREGFARLLEIAPSSRASLDRLALERIRETRAGLGALLER